MRMRILGNVWLGDRAACAGEVVDLPETDAERLAVLGVAEPEIRVAPKPAQGPTVSAQAEKPTRKRGKR